MLDGLLTPAFKREQYIFGLVAYGALCLPAAGLTAYKLSVFNALAVLYSVFNIIGFLVQAWMNVFVPYTMHHVAPIETLSDSAKEMIAAGHTDDSEEARRLRTVREREGLKMSVWGGNSMNVGLVIFYCITIGLVYASYKASLYAGLYMTTVAGGICIFTALAGWRFLPTPSGKPYAEDTPVWKLPFVTSESPSVCRHMTDLQFPISSKGYTSTQRHSSSSSPIPSTTTRPLPLAPSSVGDNVSLAVGMWC